MPQHCFSHCGGWWDLGGFKYSQCTIPTCSLAVQGCTQNFRNAEVIRAASPKICSSPWNTKISWVTCKLKHIGSRVGLALHPVYPLFKIEDPPPPLLHLESIVQDILFSQQKRWLQHSELGVGFLLGSPRPEMHAVILSEDVFGWKVSTKWKIWTELFFVWSPLFSSWVPCLNDVTLQRKTLTAKSTVTLKVT